jgi:alkylation response protein AidB-like acyl-CoA dehydrogenase
MDLIGPAGAALPPLLDPLLDEIGQDAAWVDRHGVRRSRMDELAAAGLMGAGSGLDMREVAERLAMADASTWFCWAQHQTPLRVLEGAFPGVLRPASRELSGRLLSGLTSGDLLAAVAFAHVRRPGPANPVATRTAGGWRIDGSLDWVTSWDIADVVMVMAQGSGDDAGVLVCAYLPAGHAGVSTPGLTPGSVLDLLAMGGTHTRPVTLASVHVPDEDAVVLDRAEWLRLDAEKTADVTPAVLGITRGAVSELDDVATQRGDARMRELADALARDCRDTREWAYAAASEGAPIEERRRVRALALQQAVDAAMAVITARSGAAIMRGCSSERRLREVAFMQVQAQTAASRAQSLDEALRRSAG